MDACCLDRVACNGYVIAGMSVMLALTHGNMALKRVACYQGHAEGKPRTLMLHLGIFMKSVCSVQRVLECSFQIKGN
jgi:tetrahydromethanopterin S-methyltransferase subunit C